MDTKLGKRFGGCFLTNDVMPRKWHDLLDAWARDPEASVSKRDLTLTLVTLSSYAGPLRIRTGRGFHDRHDALRTAFPLKKNLPFYLL